MSTALVFLTMAGTAMDAAGKIQQAQSQAAAQLYNAKIAETQARTYQQVGAFEQATLGAKGKAEEEKLTRAKKKTLSEQKAAYAQAGVRFEGTPIEVMADTAAEYEMDIATTRYNTQLGIAQSQYATALGTAQSLSEAQYLKESAKRTKTSGYWGAGRSLLTGGARLAGYYGQKIK